MKLSGLQVTSDVITCKKKATLTDTDGKTEEVTIRILSQSYDGLKQNVRPRMQFSDKLEKISMDEFNFVNVNNLLVDIPEITDENGIALELTREILEKFSMNNIRQIAEVIQEELIPKQKIETPETLPTTSSQKESAEGLSPETFESTSG